VQSRHGDIIRMLSFGDLNLVGYGDSEKSVNFSESAYFLSNFVV
jgi:hypothetical protein